MTITTDTKKPSTVNTPAIFPPCAYASGTSEIKTATNMARLTVPSLNIHNPITIDSGIPSRRVANIIGSIILELFD